MNERIRELAFECARQLNWNPPSDPKEYTFSSAGLEKFAELIVRECVQSIEKTIETNCDTDSEKMGCEFAITDMLEHFGVK